MSNRCSAIAISVWEVLSNSANEIDIRKNFRDIRPCDTDGEIDFLCRRATSLCGRNIARPSGILFALRWLISPLLDF